MPDLRLGQYAFLCHSHWRNLSLSTQVCVATAAVHSTQQVAVTHHGQRQPRVPLLFPAINRRHMGLSEVSSRASGTEHRIMGAAPQRGEVKGYVIL